MRRRLEATSALAPHETPQGVSVQLSSVASTATTYSEKDRVGSNSLRRPLILSIIMISALLVYAFGLQLELLRASSYLPAADAKQYHEPLPTDHLTKMSSSSGNHSSIGQQIIAASFDNSYSDLVDLCNSTVEIPIRSCLHQIFVQSLSPSKRGSFSQKWPWWFRTMLRDGASEEGKIHGLWHVLQYTEPKIQQCISEKVGTKVWRDLHCSTIQNATGKAKAAGIQNLTKFNCAKIQNRLLPDSDRVVFVRDPLDRFLSGFLDKCTRFKRKAEKHCEPFVVFGDRNIKSNTTLVNDFRSDSRTLFEIYVDTFPLKWNLHFFPQSLYCDGLYRHVKDYEFVGSMDKNLHQDLLRLEKKYPVLKGSLETYFNVSGFAVNATAHGVETKASKQTQDYYSPHTVRKVLEYFSIDYIMLDIPIPSWAEEMLLQDLKIRLQ